MKTVSKNHYRLPLMIMATLFVIFGMEVKAQDWPQFLGPDRNSTSPQKGLLKNWLESGPTVLWSVNVGRGYGGPVVKNGKVYLLDRDDDVGDMMRCFSLQTGEELWKFSYDSPGELPFPGSRSVPIVDDRHVYSCGPNGDLYCIDIQTHQPVWKKNVWKDFGGGNFPTWGISQCPIFYGDLLVIASQAPDAGVVAYNKLTGDVVWKTPKLGDATITDNYVSPKVVKINGEDQIVLVTSSTNPVTNRNEVRVMGTVTGLEPRTGKILWTYANWDCHISVPCAVDAGDNRLLIAGGYERGATMIKINRKTDGTFEISELFTTLDFGDQTKPPLLHNGYFYAMYRTNAKSEGLVCMDMNGKILWKTGRNPNFDRGSMILADGLFLATDGLSSLYLIEPSPTAFKPIAKASALREGGASMEGMSAVGGSTQNWGPMALADGKLLIRDQSRMICVKVAE
jgi:outer membrane protein assembly factor BamB